MEKQAMQLLKKQNGTGMHQTYLSPGSVVRGETLEKRTRVVLRPGNTVLCDPAELGVHGLTQFNLVGPASDSPTKNVLPKPPQTLPVMVKRKNSSYYDIVNPVNPEKPFNKKALRKKQAEAFLAELTQGEAPKTDRFDDLEWDELVAELGNLGINELKDDWETEDDLRKACRDKEAE